MIEVRMSDDGRMAQLFEEALKRDTGKPWVSTQWTENQGGITVHLYDDAEVADWKVLYRKED